MKRALVAILVGAVTGLILAPVAVWVSLEFFDDQHEYGW